MLKKCIKCKRVLSVSDFYKDSDYKDGLRNECKQCAMLESKTSRQKLKDSTFGLLDVWFDIKKRCYCKSARGYERYGGRGISMCDEWRESRKAFVEWCIKNGFKKGLQIDRIDNNGNYCPENCRFVTPSENQHNTSKTKLDEKTVNEIRINCITRKLTQRELALKLGVSQTLVNLVSKNKAWKRN